jgi:serine/threonine protein kinase
MHYRPQEIVGQGSFGITFKGLDEDNKVVAIKAINIRKSEKYGVPLSDIAQEANILQKLSERGGCGKYVVCYYEAFIADYQNEPHVFLISEFVDGTELRDFVERGPQFPVIVWPIITQLLLGLRYIHSQGFAHRDIKPENILITRANNVIKYIDFGLSCLQKCKRSNCVDNCQGNHGTVLYMAPEGVSDSAPKDFDTAKAGDVWSLADVIFELLNGSYVLPFYVKYNGKFLPDQSIIDNIDVAPQLSSNYTLDNGQSNAFVMSLLINDWHLRPTSAEAVELFVENVVGYLIDDE